MKICAVCSVCFDDSETTCHGDLLERQYSVNIVSGYRIEQAVRSTPHRSVYRARQVEYGQECELIIVDKNVDRFLADAKTASAVFDPSIAAVIESGELPDGAAYAVTEGFGDRTALLNWIAPGSLSLLDQIRIARQTAEAVFRLNSVGLVHGCISPENISLSGIGTDEISVKLHDLDLGSVLVTGILHDRFSMESGLGSIKYFAPERFGQEESTRADIYSLGLLLYELLSGHPPFEADSAAALADMHLHQKPPEIRIENFDLRMLLTHTLFEALQKQPSFRQATSDVFARQMRHIEQLATHVPTPPPAVAVTTPASSVRSTISVHNLAAKASSQAPTVIARAPSRVESVAPLQTIETPEIQAAIAVSIEPPLPFVPPATKRSRLKGIKKRLHSQILETRAILNSTPTLIEWQQPAGDIPSIGDVREELERSRGEMVQDADEEITHVRPPAGRIEVDWSEPTIADRPSFVRSYVPTLFSGRRSDPSPDPIEENSGSIFAERQIQGRDLGMLPVYGVALFALLLVGFGVVKLGGALSDDTGGYIGESRPQPIILAPAPVRNDPVEPQAEAVSIPTEIITPTIAVIDDDARSVKVSAVEPSKLEPTVAPKRTSRPEPSKVEAIPIRQVARNVDPVVPSTIVIRAGERKPKVIIVGSAPKGFPSKSGNGSTRPRIVTLPN